MKDILRDIGMIARALDSISNIEFKEIALTRGQYLYLVRIVENPGIVQGQLAELIKVDRTTAARAIAKLETNGLIERRQEAANKKQKCLYPTEKGLKRAPFILRENQYSNAQALQGFSEAEAAQLSDFLKRVTANVEQEWETVKKGQRRDY